LPVTSSILVAVAVFSLVKADWVAGASRIVLGAIQILLLFFGLAVGAQVVNLPQEVAFAPDAGGIWGTWAPLVGVVVFGIGIDPHFCGPKGSLHWFWLALLVAWSGEELASTVVGGYLAGFIGAVTMTPAVYLIARRSSGPPAHVMFLPAFWLLVPGALGLIGLADLAGGNRDEALFTFGETALSIVAIALGVLVRLAIVEAVRPFLARSDSESEPEGALGDKPV